jgi:hypothetical protein
MHVVMQQHVQCLGYVSFVLVMCSLPSLVLVQNQTGQGTHHQHKGNIT